MSGADPVLACLQGRITAEVAIARLLLAGQDAAAIRRHIQDVRTAGPQWASLTRLAQRGLELDRLRHMLDAAGVDHAEAATPAAIAALFDRAVALCPEASVALYSLGDPAALHAATGEIVDWLRAECLLARGAQVLDLGCGIGRVAAAVAPQVRWVLGIDVSAGMAREAARRCATLPNVSVAVTAGQNLACLADAMFDLVLAVDSFPYLVQAGVAERHVADAFRVLRPGGVLAVLNFSYRGDPGADRADAEAWARRYGFALRHVAASPFRRWDAPIDVFRRPDPEHGRGTMSEPGPGVAD